MTSIRFPLGTIQLEMKDGKISKVKILKQPVLKSKKLDTKVDQYFKNLQNYMDHKQSDFSDVPLPEGTVFQQAVWKACASIPYGETKTYSWIAKKIGKPKAVRAVGTALGKNPLCILIPCHRVLPQSGGIGGYAYGSKVKQWFLDHEQAKGS